MFIHKVLVYIVKSFISLSLKRVMRVFDNFEIIIKRTALFSIKNGQFLVCVIFVKKKPLTDQYLRL